MIGGGVLADEQPLADLTIRAAFGDQAQDIELALRHAVVRHPGGGVKSVSATLGSGGFYNVLMPSVSGRSRASMASALAVVTSPLPRPAGAQSCCTSPPHRRGTAIGQCHRGQEVRRRPRRHDRGSGEPTAQPISRAEADRHRHHQVATPRIELVQQDLGVVDRAASDASLGQEGEARRQTESRGTMRSHPGPRLELAT